MKRITHTGTLRQRSGKPQIPSTVVLGWWQIRQVWHLLLIIGVGVVVAVMLACTASLYSDVALTAGLRDTLTSSTQNTDITVHSTSERLDNNAVSVAAQDLNHVLQQDLGGYLSAPQFSIQTQEFPLIKSGVSLHGNSTDTATANVIAFVSSTGNQATHHISLLQGRLPGVAQDSIEVVLTGESAAQLHVSVGSSLTVRVGFVLQQQYQNLSSSAKFLALAIPLRVVGIMQPVAHDPFWHGTTFLSSTREGASGSRRSLAGSVYTGLVSSEGYLAYFSRLFARTDISKYTLELSCTLTWYYPFAASRIAIYDISHIENGIHNAQADTSNDIYFNNPPMLEQTLVYLPTDILQRFEARVPVAQVPVISLLLIVESLVFLFVGVMTTLLIERQSSTIALLRSRGASPGQISGAFAAQGFGLGLLALLIGPVLSVGVVNLLTIVMLSPVERESLNIVTNHFLPVALRLGGYSAITIIVTLSTILLAVRRSAEMNVLLLRNERARSALRPRWQRFNLDVIVAVVAVTGIVLSLYSARSVTITPQISLLLLSPLTLLCGIALVATGLLLFLRVLPALLRLSSRLTVRGRQAAPMLALAQVSRAPGQVIRMVLLLTLAVMFTTFSALFFATQNQRIADSAAYQAGADFSGTTDDMSLTSVNLPQVTSAYRHISGVLSASVGDVTTAEASSGSLLNLPVQLNAVDTTTFGQTAAWTTQDAAQPLSSLMAQLATQRSVAIAHDTIPAIVDAALWQALGLSPGAQFVLFFNGSGVTNGTVHFVAIAQVKQIPTIHDSPQAPPLTDGIVAGGMLIDYQTFAHVYTSDFATVGVVVPINYVWLRTRSDNASVESVRSTLQNPQGCCLQLATLYDRRAIIESMQQDPLYRDTIGLLLIGEVATGLLATGGSLVASWLSVRTRLTNFVVLRALGATARHLAAMLAWEQGVSYATGIGLGLVCGLLFSRLVLPSITYTGVATGGSGSDISTGQFYLMQQVPSVQIVVPPWLVLLLLALVTVFIIALCMLIQVVIKPSIQQMLRLNED